VLILIEDHKKTFVHEEDWTTGINFVCASAYIHVRTFWDLDVTTRSSASIMKTL